MWKLLSLNSQSVESTTEARDEWVVTAVNSRQGVSTERDKAQGKHDRVGLSLCVRSDKPSVRGRCDPRGKVQPETGCRAASFFSHWLSVLGRVLKEQACLPLEGMGCLHPLPGLGPASSLSSFFRCSDNGC